ncbi:hypothetical protein ACJW31_09G168900 [Castanea mollissima]
MPERAAIHYTVVCSATDEDAISKLSYLHSQQWLGNAFVVQYAIQQKEGVDNVWNIYGIKDICHREIIYHCMNKLGSKIIAVNKERAGFVIIVFYHDKATSKRVEYI